ncbi:PDDEXK family nuclease [Geoglobus acetivorans]|uniref:hypothetical protein n=1 Tax=Geoglobus acetivorans TaxID=565033 RepID=UPI00130D74C9
MSDKDYENMIKGQKAARIGLDSEKDIVHMINNNPNFQKSMIDGLSSIGYGNPSEIRAFKNGSKIDIYIVLDDEKIGVSIKSISKADFHQLDRRRLEDWKILLDMPDYIFDILKDAILRIAKNSSAKFILEKDRDEIGNFFNNKLKTILEEIFRRSESNLKLFMINDKTRHRIYVYNMDDVIEFLYKNAHNNISFTKKGIIKLGDFITVQRKGGNGERVKKYKKTDWRHPGNHLQFKFSPVGFAEYIERTGDIKFFTIDY